MLLPYIQDGIVPGRGEVVSNDRKCSYYNIYHPFSPSEIYTVCRSIARKFEMNPDLMLFRLTFCALIDIYCYIY